MNNSKYQAAIDAAKKRLEESKSENQTAMSESATDYSEAIKKAKKRLEESKSEKETSNNSTQIKSEKVNPAAQSAIEILISRREQEKEKQKEQENVDAELSPLQKVENAIKTNGNGNQLYKNNQSLGNFDNLSPANFNSDYVKDKIDLNKSDTLADRYKYIRESGVNAFQGGMDDLITGINAVGAGVLGDIQTASKALSGDEESLNKLTNRTSFKEKFKKYLDKNENDVETQTQREIEAAHPAQATKGMYSPTQIVKNIVTNINRNLPSMIAGASGYPLASSGTLAVQSMPGAYRDAKSDGATDEQALAYVVLESVNQGFGDTVLGGVSGVGKGLLTNQTAKIATKLAKNPLAKTAIQTGLTMLEEGGQEFAQSYITTLNKHIAYDSDEKFDISGATYEGILGGLNALVLSPFSPYLNYKVNKINYDIVNSFSNAASKVESETDINSIKNNANEIITEANNIINSKNSEDVDKANATYVANGLREIINQLNKNGTTIIEGNKNSERIINELANGAIEINADTASELVESISKSKLSKSGDKAVKDTVDYLKDIIQDSKQNIKAAENILNKKVDELQKKGFTQEQLTSFTQEVQTLKEQSEHILSIAQKTSETIRENKTIISKMLDANIKETAIASSDVFTQTAEANTDQHNEKTTENLQKGDSAETGELKVTVEPKEDNGKSERNDNNINEYKSNNNSDNISENSYNSDVSKIIRDEFGGKTLKETAENIIKSYGNVRNAVDFIHKTYTEYSNTGNSAAKNFLAALDTEVRTINKTYLDNNIKRISNVMKQYGIKNIEIDETITPLSVSGSRTWGQAHYNRDTGKIYVSPYADTDSIIGSKIVHEFTHHGAVADTSLVSDILKAAKESTGFNKEIKLPDGSTTTTLENLSNLIRQSYTNEINEHIAVSKNLARYIALVKENKTKTEAAKIAAEEFKTAFPEQYTEIVNNYVNEETAAYVMEQLNGDQNLLRQLINDNRPLWKQILEKIKDFIAKISGNAEARQYQKAADKIRTILEEETESKVENSSSFGDIQAKVKEHNGKIGNTSEGRRFSMELDVDESNGLFAIHNLNTSKFMKSYNLGGLAMPSIAIAKADVGHTNFGDISLVFSSDTINPEQNTKNKVYSADAWTPTFPQIEYEANTEVADKIRDKYYKLYKEYGRNNLDALYPYGNYFEEQLNSDGGVDGIIEKQIDNPKMMQVYLLDTKGEPVETVYKETVKTLPAEQVEQSQFLIDRLGSETILALQSQNGESPIEAKKRWFAEHGDEFKSAYAEYLTQAGLTAEEANAAIDNMTQYQLVSEINKARNYIQNGSETTEKTPDIEVTNNAIREAIDKKQYTEWLHSLFDGGEKKTGISNGKDKYTNSGNLRSFSATHYPVTLDNIVLSMKQQGDGNSKNATSLFVGSKTIRAESATEYSSLDEIRADKSRLSHRTAEEAKATWDEFDTRLANIIDRIMDAESNIENRFMEQDRVGKILAEASRNNTEANIKKVLAKHKLTTAVASDFKALVDDIKAAPVDIFEAKPERVVGFDEVKYAIIPADTSVELKNALTEAEIEIKTYESGNDADRLKVLNTLSDVRFSKQLDDTNAKYDYSKSFAEQIDDYKKGVFQKYDTLIVGKTPEVFQKIGLNPLPMTYGTGHLKEVLAGKTKDHNFGEANLKQIPSALENPIAIITSNTKPNSSVVAILDLSYNGKPMFAAVEIDGTGKLNGESIDSNAITTLHTRSNAANLLVTAITSENNGNVAIYYFDKTKTIQFLRSSRVQFPGVMSIKNGYVHSIHDSSSNVNTKFENVTQTQQFKRWFGDWQNHPDKASKVVNEDGTPKVVYHGTTADFTVFESSDGALGKGIYFSDSKDFARGYTYSNGQQVGDIIEVYLDMKKPYYVEYADNYDTEKLKTDGYDGIIHKANGMYVVFSPEQIKSATDNIGTFDKNNPDIRYSKEIMSAEEKRKLREAERNAYLERQLVATNAFGGKAKAIAPSTKNKIAKQIASGMPGVTTNQVNEQLTNFYNTVEHPKAITKQDYAEEVKTAAKEAAKNLYNEFKIENVNPMYEEYKETYNHIKNLKFKITDGLKNEFGKREYSDFYQRAKGTLKLRVNDGINVDMVWEELCELYPQFFSPKIILPSEQLEKILEVQNSLKKIPGHPFYDVSDINEDAFSANEDIHMIKDIADALIATYVNNAKTTVAAENKSLKNQNERLTKEADTARAEAFEAKKTLEVTQTWNDAELKKIYSEFTKSLGEEQRKFEGESKRADRLSRKIATKNVNAAQKIALKEIGRLQNNFDNPTKKKHIPQNMRESVGAYLSILNGTKLLNGKTVSSVDINETLETERNKINQKLSAVVNSLKSNDESEVYALSNRQIEVLTQKLERLNSVVGERNVDLSNNIDYINTVTQITRMINHYVSKANSFFTDTRKIEADKFAADWIRELKTHNSRIGATGNERPIIKKALDGVEYSYMSADLFFSTMGEIGSEISSWYRKAQTHQVKMKQEYAEFMKNLLGNNYNTKSGSVDAKNNLIDVNINGNEIKVSRNQLMSLYLTWNRPAGKQHLETGGAAFTNANNETNDVYVINQKTYDSLIDNLSTEDKKIADGIVKFLSVYCADWGNDASMKLYGIRLYEDSNYFPLRTPSEIRDTNFSNLTDTHTLENLSFTRQLNKNATSPVVIGDVFDIADKHVNDMSAYAAYAPLNNSMERIFNSNGLKRALSSAYGNDGVKYVQEFIDKVNGNSSKKGLGENINKLLNFTSSNAKKAAVALNFSTALKQPLSIVRAALVIDPKYLTEAYVKLPPIVNTLSWKTGEYKRIYDTMNEYSGIAVIKSQGYSDTGIGESLRSTYDETSNNFQSKADNAFMKPAEFADEITWVRLWKACELEIKEKYGNDISENEYIERVTNKFNEIIGKTQVVDSFMDTAPISNNRLFKTLYPFMNEPVKTTATLLTAAENIRNGKNNGKKQMIKAVGCFIVSNIILEPVVSTLVAMFRHDLIDNPDDFAKKFTERLLGIKTDSTTTALDIISSNAVDGLFSTPFIGAIYDTIINTLNGYDPQRLDLQPVADLVGSLKYFFNSLDKEDYENQKTKSNYFLDALASIAQIVGVPVSTIKRDTSAVVRNAVGATKSYTAQWELNKLYYNLGNSNARANKNFYDIMSKAYKAGDTDAYSYMLKDLKATQTGTKSFGVSYKNINKYITENGAEIEVGSDMWYVSLQAEYLLDSFVPTMKVEKVVTDVYKKAKEAGLDDYDKAIYTAQTSISKFSVNGEDYEMNLEEFNTYQKGTGDFAYKITNALSSNYQWNDLSTEQKLFALKKTYEFSKVYWKKKINSDYSISTKWMDELYNTKVDFQKYARAIITQAKNK